MKNKTLAFIIASALILIFLVSFANATFSVSTNDITFSSSSTPQTFTITNDVSPTTNLTIATPSISSINGVFFNLTGNLNDINQSSTITITPTNPIDFSTFDFLESFSTTFVLENVTNSDDNETITVTIENTQFCEESNPGELKVSVQDIQVIEGFGDDEEWFLFDEIEIELEIRNRGDDDIDNIEVEWGLYDTESEEWAIEIDNLKDFNLKDGDEETIILSFQIDEDLDENLEDLREGIYTIYVRATGDVDDSSNSVTCASDSEDVEMIIDSNFVILNKLEVPEIVQCGADMHFSADVWNIGDRNQDDVYVRIESSKLKIFEEIIVGDIDSFEDDKINFDFTLPKDLEEGDYYLILSVYDEDDDVYESSNDDNSVFEVPFKVEGGCSVAQASVSASLESGGQAGKPLVVKSIIANTGDKETTYILNAASYASWASQASLEQSSITLSPGESKEILITFEVNKDVEGTQIFNLEVLAENELIVNQPVQVQIDKSGFNLPAFSGNWHLWAIGALNLILVIFIIIIAIRIARK